MTEWVKFCKYHGEHNACEHPKILRKKAYTKLEYHCIKEIKDLFLLRPYQNLWYYELKCEGCPAFKPIDGLEALLDVVKGRNVYNQLDASNLRLYCEENKEEEPEKVDGVDE